MDLIFYRLLLLPILIPSLVIHELAHGFTSQWLGDPTPRMSGRLTLNPLAHLDPIGLLLLIIAGFGFARPVPINPYYYKNPRRDEALVGLAGPASNFLLAWLLAIIFFKILGLTPSIGGFFFELVQLSIWLNLALAVFNLIPVPPLDGSHILAAILPDEMAEALVRIGPFGLMIAVLLILTPLTGQLIVSAVSWLYNLIVSFP